MEVDLGATVTLRCDVDGNPTPDIEWINENSDVVISFQTILQNLT